MFGSVALGRVDRIQTTECRLNLISVTVKAPCRYLGLWKLYLVAIILGVGNKYGFYDSDVFVHAAVSGRAFCGTVLRCAGREACLCGQGPARWTARTETKALFIVIEAASKST